MRSLVIRGAEVEGLVADVRVVRDRVVAVAPHLVPHRDDEVVSGGGAALLPGLHDHHIHLLALAASKSSVDVGLPGVRDREGLAAVLRAADSRLPAGAWLRAVGYHEGPGVDLDARTLDEIVPGRMVRIQHRSGALWILSSAAVRATRLADAGDLTGIERRRDGSPTGRVWRLDGWLRDRLPPEPLDIAGVSVALLRYGTTSVTDATPTEDASSLRLLADAVQRGELLPRVVVTGGVGLANDEIGGLERGPVKLVLSDHEPLVLDALLAGVEAARAAARPVAVHCVTAAAVALTIAALEELGSHPGDRIEHGAVMPLALAQRIAALGVTVVTNPGFVAERGDQYLTDVEPDELADLWRCRSLLDAGVSVGAGTDAPFASPNPWAAMGAAVDRRTSAGATLGAGERLGQRRALSLFLAPLGQPGGGPRTVEPGAAADLCLLRTPLAEALGDLGSVRVAATVVRGEVHLWP